MRRVLHVLGKMDRAGAETMVMNIYRQVDRNQYQFDFVVFSKKEGNYDAEILSLGGRIYRISKSNFLARMLELRRLLKAHPEYQIIHCHTLFSNAFHLLAAYMANVPYRLVHSHNTSDLSGNKFVRAVYHLSARKMIRQYATHFIACGEAAANFLFPGQSGCLIIPNSIDAGFFTTTGEEKRNYIDELYRLEKRYLKLIQVGRLEPVKNHTFTINLAGELKRRGVFFKMFFVGQGSLLTALENKVRHLGLDNEVVFLGVRTDIPQLMAGADVMMMPSHHEGFPVVLVEAQAVGVPSLVSDTISREVDLGLDLVQFTSLQKEKSEWVESLIALKDKGRQRKCVRLSHLTERGFDIKASTERLLNLYNSLK